MNPPCTDIEEIMEEEGAPAWMVTFADLMSLLLVFFILLFTMSEVEVERFKTVMVSINQALSTGASGDTILEGSDLVPVEATTITPPAEIPMPPEAPPAPPDHSEIMAELNELVNRRKFGEFLVVYDEGERIIIRIEGHAIFHPAEVEIISHVRPALDEILTLFRKHADFSINIKGHTDNQPIRTLQFPSNWELSAVRATTVLRYFLERGIAPARMTATGYAAQIPIADNDSAQGRAMNRRVEFVLEKRK